MSERLLVLGAGPAQLGLLEAARARGVWLAVVDRDPAAPGFRLADRRCILSTEDEPAIERLVGALEIDGIISPGTDWPVGVAARIAERAGLPHPISPQTAVLATNKLRQRERLAEAGVPQPRSWVVGGEDEPPEVDGPVVVKAPDRQGQKGLTLVARPGGARRGDRDSARRCAQRPRARRGARRRPRGDGRRLLGRRRPSRRSPSPTGSSRSRPPSASRSRMSGPRRGVRRREGVWRRCARRRRARDRERAVVHPAAHRRATGRR